MTNIQTLCKENNVNYRPFTQLLPEDAEIDTNYICNKNCDDFGTIFVTTEEELIELIKTGTIYEVIQNKSIRIPEYDYTTQIDDATFNEIKNDMQEYDPELFVALGDATCINDIVDDEDLLSQVIYQFIEYYG
jgi:hypothetical protein